MSASGRVRLVLLYGGRSAEHEVSCVSAFHVATAVDPHRYDLRLVGITRDGRWVEATGALAAAASGALPSPDRISSRKLEPTATVRQGEDPLVVLPLLHGPMGEDGTVQGLLELAGVAYAGAGVAGSAAAMDKAMAKALFRSAGLPQARHLVLRESEREGPLARAAEGNLGWPVFVKPANLGSSIGISKVAGPSGLAAALELAWQYDDTAIVEEAVRGRELEIGVLGWPELRASVPGEVRPSHDFYDYEDKYIDDRAQIEVPARLPAEVAAHMASLAVEACRVLRVDSMARVDFFYEEEGRGLLINEVNTIPGFTPISMFPKVWIASGLSYPGLVDELVDQALRRHARRSHRLTTRLTGAPARR